MGFLAAEAAEAVDEPPSLDDTEDAAGEEEVMKSALER